MKRRSFLATLAAGLAAPAICQGENLMRLARPERFVEQDGIIVPRQPTIGTLYLDGVKVGDVVSISFQSSLSASYVVPFATVARDERSLMLMALQHHDVILRVSDNDAHLLRRMSKT